MQTKTCERCGKEFSYQPNRRNLRRFCSIICARRAIDEHKRQNKQEKPSQPCAQCGKPFVPRDSKQRFCSRTCGNLSRRGERHERTCIVCGNTFTQARSELSGKYCSRACSDSADKSAPRRLPRIKKVCPFCNKEFETLPYNETGCCSRTCAARHKAKTVVGENHPLHKPKVEMKCEVCGKVCQVKPSLVSRFRACSRRCASYLGKIANPRISSIETAMLAALEARGLSPQGQFSEVPFWIDIAFPSVKLAIECDGDYWHGNKRQQAKDRQKDHYLRRRGWHVLRITETEIKTDIDECVAKVISFLSTQPTLLPMQT